MHTQNFVKSSADFDRIGTYSSQVLNVPHLLCVYLVLFWIFF